MCVETITAIENILRITKFMFKLQFLQTEKGFGLKLVLPLWAIRELGHYRRSTDV